MIWDYIKEIWEGSWEFATSGGDIIEILVIGAIAFFLPKLLLKHEKNEKFRSESARAILWHKFLINDGWRAFVVTITLLVFCIFVIAPFQLYKQIEPDNERLKAQLADRSPKLEGFIHRIVAFDEGDSSNSIIFLDVSVSNLGGMPSDAEEYGLKVIISTNASTTADELKISDEYKLNFTYKEQPWLLALKRRQLIAEKTIEEIPVGEDKRGWLAYRLYGVKIRQYDQTNIIFSFEDNFGKQTAVTNGFWMGRRTVLTNSDDFTMEMHGAENIFSPVEPPRHNQLEDWIPPESPPGCSNITIFFGTQPLNYTRQMADILAATNGVKFEIKDLPDYFLKNLDNIPNFTPRLKNIWIRPGSESTTIGGKTFAYPIVPVIVSNRLYLEVNIPFSNEKKTLVMNDSFDPNLSIPRLWDRNYSTNYDEFGNGLYYYEIVNELTNPVLQVAYAAPNVVLVNGIFNVDSNSIFAAFGQAPALLTFSNYDVYGLQTTQRITTISLQSQTFREIIGFRTNDSQAEVGEVWTNELYRPIFQNQRRIFKYPSYLNIGVLEDYNSTNKSDTNNTGNAK